MTQKEQGATTAVMDGGQKISLSVIRLCRMGVPPNEALDMSGTLHLTMDFLLNNEHGNLASLSWLANVID